MNQDHSAPVPVPEARASDSLPALDLAPTRPTQVRWLVFALACGTSFILYLHRYTWAIIKKDVAAEFGWSTDILGWLDSAFNLSYAIGQVPGGMLGDWFGTHLVLTAMIAIWTLALGSTVFTRSAWDMAAYRFLFGLSQAGCYPNLGKATKSWFPTSVRTIVQGWVASFFGRMGGAASYILFGTVLLGYYGLHWRTATFLFAGVGLLFAVAFYVLFRSSPAQHPWSNAAEAGDVVQGDPAASVASGSRLNWGLALSNRNVRAMVFQQFTCAFVDNVFSNWIPFFLLQQKKVSMTSAGWMAALPLMGGALGGMIGGTLQSGLIHWTGNRRWSRSLVGLTGNSLAMVFMFTSLLFDEPLAIVLVFAVLKFFADWAQPTCWATVTDIGGRSSASVFAIVNTAGSIGGVLAGPVMGGIILVFSGNTKEPNAAGWTALFITLGTIYMASALSWLFIDCTCPIEKNP